MSFNKTIGILGGGQLGRMLALAGYPLGLKFKFFDPDPNAPAGHLAECVHKNYSDLDSLKAFAGSVDVLTYEFENIPVEAARALQGITPIYPSPEALEVSQDRLVEKTRLQSLGIVTAPFSAIDTSPGSIDHAVAAAGIPGVLKTRRMGYDGKGQSVVLTRDELQIAVSAMENSSLILEGFVPFSSECSLISVRSVSGEMKFYPLIQNVHHEGILRRSTVNPSGAVLDPGLFEIAKNHATALMNDLNYVGILTIEYFVRNGALIANEIAPRVHNSGHWSIEGAETSQFENHVRALLDLPLGSTNPNGYIGMLNIIGELPDTAKILSTPGAHLHLYGKSPRPNRKIGHITVRSDTAEIRDSTIDALSKWV